jgi:hypothetical protein
MAELSEYLSNTSAVPAVLDPHHALISEATGWASAGWHAICRAAYEALAGGPLAGEPEAPHNLSLAHELVEAEREFRHSAIFRDAGGCLRTYVLRSIGKPPQRRCHALLSEGRLVLVRRIPDGDWWPCLPGGDGTALAIVVSRLEPAVGLVASGDLAHAAAGALLWQYLAMLRACRPGARLLTADVDAVAECVGVDRLFETPIPYVIVHEAGRVR